MINLWQSHCLNTTLTLCFSSSSLPSLPDVLLALPVDQVSTLIMSVYLCHVAAVRTWALHQFPSSLCRFSSSATRVLVRPPACELQAVYGDFMPACWGGCSPSRWEVVQVQPKLPQTILSSTFSIWTRNQWSDTIRRDLHVWDFKLNQSEADLKVSQSRM